MAYHLKHFLVIGGEPLGAHGALGVLGVPASLGVPGALSALGVFGNLGFIRREH